MSPRSASACVEHGAVKGEGERDLAALAFGLDRGVELIEKAHPAFAAEAHDVADRKPLARLHQRVPARAVEPFDQRRRDRRFAIAAADAAAVQTRRDHLGVVDDERVAGTQQVRQVAHGPVLEHAAAPGCTTRSRAASRGEAGRSAMRSSGKAKSNRSVRIAACAAASALIAGLSRAPRRIVREMHGLQSTRRPHDDFTTWRPPPPAP